MFTMAPAWDKPQNDVSRLVGEAEEVRRNSFEHSTRRTWTVLGDTLADVLDDASVCVEEVVAGHARFARNSSWNDDETASSEGSTKLLLTDVSLHRGARLDVTEVGSDLNQAGVSRYSASAKVNMVVPRPSRLTPGVPTTS